MDYNQKFCQSCGMPMGHTNEMYGHEANGEKNADYCIYCYDKGAFTSERTMDEMIEICVQPMVESNPGMTADTARQMMREFMPMLKRWKA